MAGFRLTDTGGALKAVQSLLWRIRMEALVSIFWFVSTLSVPFAWPRTVTVIRLSVPSKAKYLNRNESQ